MHDARLARVTWTTRRLVTGLLTACALAGALAITVPTVQNSLICSIYTPNDIEWILFGCFLNPPHLAPRT